MVWYDYLGAYETHVPIIRFYDPQGNPLTKVRSLFVPQAEGLWYGGLTDVDLSSTGNCVVTWYGNDTALTYPHDAIYVRIVDSLGNYLSNPVVANEAVDLMTPVYWPHLAADDSGNFVVIWSDRTNGLDVGSNLWAQKFDASANPIGSNFRINSVPNSLYANYFAFNLDILRNKIVFAWQDWRNSSTYGWDMYGKLMEVGDIGFYIPGDLNMDGVVSTPDIISLINHLFRRVSLVPLHPADVNANCSVSVGDLVYLINFLFRQGPPPQQGCA